MKKRNLVLLTSILLFSASCKKGESGEITKPGQEITSKDSLVSSSVIEVEQFINECEFIARSIKTAYPNQPGILSNTEITVGQTEEGKKKYDIIFKTVPGSATGRAGKLTVVFENAFENGIEIQGKHVHVRSDEDDSLYQIKGVKFKGSLVFSNISTDRTQETVVNHLNAQSFLLKPAGEKIKFSSRRKSMQKAGISTPEINDDVFEMTDQNYSLDIIRNTTEFAEVESLTPLTLTLTCQQADFSPKKGKIKVEHIGGNTKFLSFGNGNCNDIPVILNTP